MLLGWTLVVVVSFYSLNKQSLEHHKENVLVSTRTLFKQIVLTRTWNSRMGQVYVPVSSKIQPNPYLDIPYRDVITNKGVKLTTVNPAYMTRLISEIAKEFTEIQYHITSLKPLRPGNKPNLWEGKQLLTFAKGRKEAYGISLHKDKHIFRYMAPLFVKKECLPCHAKQGYKIGDIRGGIAVYVPFVPHKVDLKVALTHGLLALIGYIGILFLSVYEEKNNKIILESQKEAERGNRAKTDFLLSMSHEIRTPMNAIIGMTDLVMQTDVTEESLEYLITVKEASNHLLSVINEILDSSRLETGKKVLDKRTFILEDLLFSCTNLFKFQAKEKGIDICLNIDEDIPQYFYGDADSLLQILINLVGNALKFTMEGSITIEVHEEKNNLENEIPDDFFIVCFSVKDTGIGIPEENIEHLFEKFEQVRDVSGDYRTKEKGTGLGLYITKSLIELMDGEIHLKSNPGKGSDFYFNITLEIRDSIQKVVLPSNDDVPYLMELKILLAEDNVVNARLAIVILEKLHHHVVVAANGRDAVEILSTGDFDIVLMDIEMPFMDGLEATQMIRSGGAGENNRTIPVIAMTAHVISDVSDQCIAVGMNDFIAKPIHINELNETISKVMYESDKPGIT